VTVELLAGSEELRTAGSAPVDPFSFGIGVFTRERSFGSRFSKDPVFGVGESGSPFIIGKATKVLVLFIFVRHCFLPAS
jgi:hypothetical protein